MLAMETFLAKRKFESRLQYGKNEVKEAFEDMNVADPKPENELKWDTVEGALQKDKDPVNFYYRLQ